MWEGVGTQSLGARAAVHPLHLGGIRITSHGACVPLRQCPSAHRFPTHSSQVACAHNSIDRTPTAKQPIHLLTHGE